MILDKAQMAHDWAMKHGNAQTIGSRQDMIKYAWEYADKMQAEADKRVVKLPDVFFDTKTNEEWQPDWSQAPDEFKWFAIDMNKDAYFYSYEPYIHEDSWGDSDCIYSTGTAQDSSSSFNYQGDWRNSLRKRPN